ncbi:uncharacterized protein BDW70DRAFT_134463 [Aspergillus foveolatus]|uniref:uncharacterized protein n=1 Tax=Aspergillus foveolatus TaxID=210207 RepID=UPI003CCD90CB
MSEANSILVISRSASPQQHRRDVYSARRRRLAFSTMSEERSQSRGGQTGPLRPRIPNFRGSFSGTQHPRLVSNNMQSETSSPVTPQTPPTGSMDHSRRPSAASIHSRRAQSKNVYLSAAGLYGVFYDSRTGYFLESIC